ncbi:MAG: hypothetical protein ABJB11_02955 [Ferruginibacter sp.]
MKQIIYVLLLLQSLGISAQDTGIILKINPFGNDVTKQRLKYGTMVKFRISNVNSFKIEGTNSVSKQSISFDVPAAFSQPLADNSGGIAATQMNNLIKEKEDSSKLLANIIQLKGSSIREFADMKTAVGVQSLTSKFSKNIKKLEDEIKILAVKKKKLDAEIIALQDKAMQDIKLMDSKSAFIVSYNCFMTSLNKIALYVDIDAFIDSLLKETYVRDTETFKTNLDNYMTNINDDNGNINLLRGKCKKALEDITTCYINAKSAYEDLSEQIKAKEVKLSGELISGDKAIKLKIDNSVATIKMENKFEKEFQFLSAKFEAINSENKRTEIINKANTGVNYYYKVRNCSFEVLTDGQQLNDDVITIIPKLKDLKGNIVKEFNPITFKTYGGWKIDFSSGYLLSFKGDENYTNLYDNSGIIGVQKNKTDHLKHAIGALFNAYPRTGRDINMGLSVGISVPTDGTSIGFYGGLSALMLEKNRLVLTVGAAFNKIKLLNTGNLVRESAKEKITGKETYEFSNKDFKEIKYDDVYRPAFFIGITYNVFTVKK